MSVVKFLPSPCPLLLALPASEASTVTEIRDDPTYSSPHIVFSWIGMPRVLFVRELPGFGMLVTDGNMDTEEGCGRGQMARQNPVNLRTESE